MAFKVEKTENENVYKVIDNNEEYYIKKMKEVGKDGFDFICKKCFFLHKDYRKYCSKIYCGSNQHYYNKIEKYELLFLKAGD